MTREEALEILDRLPTIGEQVDALEMAIKALEKQIPKPVEYVMDYTWAIGDQQPECPVCESYLTRTVFIPIDGAEGKKISYCDHCGQAIDWEA